VARILIVEDHRFFARALELILGQRLSEEPAGRAEFHLAPTVREGLEIADAEGPFDVAIVDLLLPDGDGTELVRRIKASYPETRVAVLSSVRDLSGAIEAGADEAIGKGTPLPEILSHLARVVTGGGDQTGA
jgi:two-component system, NarL family, response regulator DevR